VGIAHHISSTSSRWALPTLIEKLLYDKFILNLCGMVTPMLLLDPTTLETAAEQRVTLYGITWEEYTGLSEIFVDRSCGCHNRFPRMTYLEGTLEITMTTSIEHESLKKIITRLLEAYAEEQNLDLNGYGNATFQNQSEQWGVEPDECYCLGALKEVPDIALEIVLTSGGVSKLAVYQGLGVPEVWFWQQEKLAFYHLAEDGKDYLQSDRTLLLPDLDPELLISFIDLDRQTQSVRNYRQSLQASGN
jgi:Uma2 family endonuclease